MAASFNDDRDNRRNGVEDRERERDSQLIWQIIASRCKQGGSICLGGAERDARRDSKKGGRAVPRGVLEARLARGWISKGKTRDINPRRSHGLLCLPFPSLFLSRVMSHRRHRVPTSPDAFAVLNREILRLEFIAVVNEHGLLRVSTRSENLRASYETTDLDEPGEKPPG